MAGVELPATPPGLRAEISRGGSLMAKAAAMKQLRALQKSRLHKVVRAETYADATLHAQLREKDRKRKNKS